jgi:hypothetical protein
MSEFKEVKLSERIPFFDTIDGKDLMNIIESQLTKMEMSGKVKEEMLKKFENLIGDIVSRFESVHRHHLSPEEYKKWKASKEPHGFNQSLLSLIKEMGYQSIMSIKMILSGIREVTVRLSQVPVSDLESTEKAIAVSINELFGTDTVGLFEIEQQEGQALVLKRKVFIRPEMETLGEVRQKDLKNLEEILNANEKFTRENTHPYLMPAWDCLKSSQQTFQTPSEGVGADVWIKLTDGSGKALGIVFADHTDAAHVSNAKSKLVFYPIKEIMERKYADALLFRYIKEERDELKNKLQGK